MKNKKYEPEDLPRHKKMDEDLSSAEVILKLNKLLSHVGLGSDKILNIKEDIEKLKEQKNELTLYPTKYNRYFSEKGWIAHDTMDFEVIKNAVDYYEKNEVEKSEEVIMDYYSPEKVELRLIYFRHIPEFKIRMKFLEFAVKDYKEKRYYAVVLSLLTIIDGVVNDVAQKGFHSENLDLNVWDSLTSTDTGIQVIKNIFTKGRKKTNTEKLDLPFRNGILHGRDLEYDNYVVACKTWAFIFFVKDWINSKKQKKNRVEQFNKKNETKSLSEILNHRKENQKISKLVEVWKPREISSEYISTINEVECVNKMEPEFIVINFLEYWKKKNYGKMAELFSLLVTSNRNKYIVEVRNNYDTQNLTDFRIVQILDEAPAITEIIVEINCNNTHVKKIKFRCIYEKSFNECLPRGVEGGNWKIVWVNNFE